MSKRPAASPDDAEIASIGRAFRKFLPLLFVASFLAGAATYGALTLSAPKYQSQAELTIIARGSNGPMSDLAGDGGGFEAISTRMDREAINTHVQALLSPDLANKIAADLNLDKRAEFNSAVGPADALDETLRLAGLSGPRPGETEQDRVLSQFYKQLDVYAARESRFIGIRFSSSNPQLAADVANRIAEEYRSRLANQSVSEVDEVQNVLQSKIDKLILEVADAESSVERFRGEVNIFKGSQNTGLNEQQLGDLTSELTRASAARSEADARARAAKEMMKYGSADALPDVQRSPLIQNLVQQRVTIERQISELSTTLLPGHPRMRQHQADLAGLKRQIESEASKVVQSLEKEAKVAALREESIKKSLDEIKARVVDKGPDEAKLRQLEAVAKTKRNELENLQTQFESNRKRADSRIVPIEAKIITRARPASVPSYPKKGSSAALVALATLLLGVASVFMGALLSSRRHEFDGIVELDDDQPSFDYRLSGPPKRQTADARKTNQPEPTKRDASRSSGLKPLTAIAAELSNLNQEWGGHRVIVAGAAAHIDAADEAEELAEKLALQHVPVVIVDWARPGEGLADILGMPAGPGLGELLSGAASFGEILDVAEGRGAHIVRRGEGLDEPIEIDADQLNMALDALDEAYAYVVFTGTYDELAGLFAVIEGRVDSAVIVYEAGSAPDRQSGKILGFDVTEIDIFAHGREEVASLEQAKAAMAGGRRNAKAAPRMVRAG